MDVEAELIQTEKWSELKRYYASKAGHSWELGWVYFLKSKDLSAAAEEFSKSLSDPRYEEASQILLWKLGKRLGTKAVLGPPSLKLYDAYISGRPAPLLNYLEEASAHSTYLPFLFRPLLEKLSLRELSTLEIHQRPASFSLCLAEVYDRKWKDHEKAKVFYQEFLADPWTKNILEENRRQIFDSEASRRIRMAYAQKDLARLKKELLAALSFCQKISSSSSPRNMALKTAIEADLENLSQNLLGFPFWKETELSPHAIQMMRGALFSKEEDSVPPFIKFWTDFFAAESLIPIPPSLDPNSLSLWQLRVEMNPELLAEALLRFPQEERFLFLWSLKQREKSKIDPRRWPAEQRESSVVRKSLEKAFERTANKVLWFDRLRVTGCSQDFYEYAVQKSPIPILWILEDLEKNFISNTQGIRSYLRDQLSVTAPNDSETHLLKPAEFLKGLSYLTPAEKQQVLLSRFVLSDIPSEILNDEFMDLFLEARSRVSAETFEKWQKVIVDHLGRKGRKNLSEQDWKWIELAWEKDPRELERFSPTMGSTTFPWEIYLEKLETQKKPILLFDALAKIPDERLKETWIRRCLLNSRDEKIYSAIQTLQIEFSRYDLLAEWYERQGEIEKALEARELELSSSPILNDQIRIARQTIHLLQKLSGEILRKRLSFLDGAQNLLELNGALDVNLCSEIGELYAKASQFEQAFQSIVNQWSRSSPVLKEELLPKLLERAFQARAIDATQRILVDYVFEQGTPGSLTYEILGSLFDSESVFKIRHLRKEFIDRASQLFPLHREALRARTAYDYRALLLWQSFYGDSLEEKALPLAHEKKRKHELWRLTESVSHVDSAAVFTKYLNSLPKPPQKKPGFFSRKKEGPPPSEFLEKARRIAERLSKSYGIKKSITIDLREDLLHPLVISFKPFGIELKTAFFKELDEEMWSAIVVGAFQIFDDFEKGLFDEKHLMERFFQGMLLSCAPIAKLVRLWVWLAIHEGLIEPTLLKSDPETLIEKLPLVNSLLIFYLGPDFSQKVRDCGLELS